MSKRNKLKTKKPSVKPEKTGIRLRRDSWHTTVVAQKLPECPSLEGHGLRYLKSLWHMVSRLKWTPRLLILTVTSPFDHYKSGLETPAWHSDSVPLAIGRWPDAARQVACGVDQSDMRECLREIAHQASRPGVVFF